MQDILNVSKEIDATISTMTVLVKFDDDNDSKLFLSLERVLREYVAEDVQDFIEEVCGNKECITTSSKKPFHNSIVFKTKGIPVENERILEKQSVKIFCNGNMHITGVKNVKDALYLADIFVTILELVYGGTRKFRMVCYDIQLINFYLTIPCVCKGDDKNKRLDLRKAHEVLTKNTPYYVCYNTERHPGVIVKAIDFTLILFDSFNVLISSIKRVDQLVCAKEFVRQQVFTLVDGERDNCCVDVPLIIKGRVGKRKADIAFDYSKYIMLK